MTKQLESAFKDFPTEEELLSVIMHTSSTVWENELVRKDIERWLDNFEGAVFEVKYERLMALWLLTHFTYYNKNEVTHLCRIVYKDLIHRIVSRNRTSSPVDLVTVFLERANIITFEKVGGSGGFIAYLFRLANDLPMTLFNFSIDNVSDEIESIILIDDVTLTPGRKSQVHKFLRENVGKHDSKRFYLLTLVASASSVECIRNDFGVEVVTAISLDDRDKCFNPEADIFAMYPALIGLARKLAEHYGKRTFAHPLGYSDGQYTFGFFYNTPDNALPIFWGQKNGWTPIVTRYHKKYRAGRFLGNERFI